MKRYKMYLAATALLVVGLQACRNRGPLVAPAGLHPVIILDIDTLRADHLGCYGYGRSTRPNIDALARDSVLFQWASARLPTRRPRRLLS